MPSRLFAFILIGLLASCGPGGDRPPSTSLGVSVSVPIFGGGGRLSIGGTTPVATGRGGGVCGDPRIEGEVLSRIDGPGACGIDRPVRLTRVSGIAITGEQVVSCAFAREFADWAEGARFGTGAEISSLQSYAGYTCRTRNGLPGERISNHAFGNAIDIGVIGFANGERVSVEDGWNDPAYARIVRTLHGTACSDFDTVLGPEFDAAHRNHLHFDIDPDRRGGAFCR